MYLHSLFDDVLERDRSISIQDLQNLFSCFVYSKDFDFRGSFSTEQGGLLQHSSILKNHIGHRKGAKDEGRNFIALRFQFGRISELHFKFFKEYI